MPMNGMSSTAPGWGRQGARRPANMARGSGNAKTGGNKKGKPKIVQGRGEKSLEITEEALEAERAAWLANKKSYLETVLENHDTMVREIFHMEKFRNMLAFDPLEAKKDASTVFSEYKTQHFDLVGAVPGPSRATRRSHTQRKQLLFEPSPSVSATGAISPALNKSKLKNTAVIWERLNAQTKGRGKGADIEILAPTAASPSIEGVDRIVQPSTGKEDAGAESISAVRARRHISKKGKGEEASSAPPVAFGEMRGRKVRKEHLKDTKGIVSIPTRRSGRLAHEMDSSLSKEELLKISQTVPAKRSLDMVDGSATTPSTKFHIKRIRLVVRRPPLPVTNPKQRPPSSKFNASLGNFLRSYISHNGEDINAESLRRQVVVDAAVLERTELFRKQGRFIPGTDVLFGFNIDTSVSYTTPQRTVKDHWDHLVEVAILESKAWNKRPSGRQVAAQIASKIQAYWDSQEAKKDKLKSQEERRLRALAKATIKMVTNEWKKAVFHIREQERLKQEAEEVRRGHAHLDAILDQSGQLLETQQEDLARRDLPLSRSRSSSMHGWGSEVDEDEDIDEDDAGEDSDDETVESGEEDGDDVNAEQDDDFGGTTHMLLDDTSSHAASHATPESISLSVVDPSEVYSTEADTVHSALGLNGRVEDVDIDDGSSVVAVGEPTANTGFNNSPLHPISLRSRSQSSTSSLNFDKDTLRSASPALFTEYSQSPKSSTSNLFHPLFGVSPSPSPHHSPRTSVSLDYDIGETALVSGETMYAEAISPPTALNSDVQVKESVEIVKSLAATPASAPGRPTEITEPLSEHPKVQKALLLQPHDIPEAASTSALSQTIHALPGSDDFTPPIESKGIDEVEEPEEDQEQIQEEEFEPESRELAYLKQFAVAKVEWDATTKIIPPLLLRGNLRPYQQLGLEWLASLHANKTNGILADEMGLGKTIQTIALLAHLACDRGIWGPHLIVVPTSVLLNWEMEFKKFLPGFKILSYHGSTKRRKELRQGWTDKHHFNVCITSYTLASRDAHIFKRKPWYYMILDEAHMIKNFKSQRWNILLMFRSYRRLLLTGTPLQNNLTELWALLQFLMSGSKFANVKEFGEWFSDPLERAIEMGSVLDDETMQRVNKLHTVLRPYLLRRLKRDVEKELPSKYEHLVMCPLSKRQRFLYDEFMSRAHTRDALQSGVYQKIANILMQLRKVCNHPDLFEVRPIVTSFAMTRSAVADFEIKELLVRRQLLDSEDESLNFDLLGLQFINHQITPLITALESRRLDATVMLPFISEAPGEPPPKDTRTIAGFRKYSAYLERANKIARWTHIGYLNRLRCNNIPIYSQEILGISQKFYRPILPLSAIDIRSQYWETVQPLHAAVKSYTTRSDEMASIVDRFAFVTPPVVALDMPRIVLSGSESPLTDLPLSFDTVLHQACVKLQIAFPDPSLLQYDCGKLQELARLLRDKKAGGHRVLIFTQMTKILDILEIFLNFHGYLYLRLDGATKIEDRQYITERFNADSRIFCFIASSRSGGVGINLTGADTVVFYDSDFNPQMDRQCEDRAHRIGQIRDVHIYRFVSQHTVEEAMLRKANQKRSLDDLVIQKGEFDWRSLFNDEGALTKALGEFEDTEDAHAAVVAASEEVAIERNDEAEFGGDVVDPVISGGPTPPTAEANGEVLNEPDEDQEEGGSVVEYMIFTVQRDYDFFRDWRL